MAWASQGEEVLIALTHYLAQLNPRKKAKLRRTYNKAINHFLGEWTNLNKVTFINLKNRENVWSNLSLATLKESIGLGPQQYCVICSYKFDFETLFMLTLYYLPKEKFCMYPEDESLASPFLYAPWDILGQRIYTQPTISIDSYLAYLEYRARVALLL